MKIKNLILEEIKNFIQEEFTNGKLFGYHVTPCENIPAIGEEGLRTGRGAMEGEGIYGFYNFERAIGYGSKNINKFCIVKFEITNFNKIFILNTDIAKEVLGNQHHILNQIEKIYAHDNGYDGFAKEVKKIYPNWSDKKIKDEIIDAYENNNGIKFKNYLIPHDYNALQGGIIWDGQYGLQFLIRYSHYISIIGYYEINPLTGEHSELKSFKSNVSEIFTNQKYNSVAEFINQNNIEISNEQDLNHLKNNLENKLMQVRNNRDYDYLTLLINQINEFIYNRKSKNLGKLDKGFYI